MVHLCGVHPTQSKLFLLWVVRVIQARNTGVPYINIDSYRIRFFATVSKRPQNSEPFYDYGKHLWKETIQLQLSTRELDRRLGSRLGRFDSKEVEEVFLQKEYQKSHNNIWFSEFLNLILHNLIIKQQISIKFFVVSIYEHMLCKLYFMYFCLVTTCQFYIFSNLYSVLFYHYLVEF